MNKEKKLQIYSNTKLPIMPIFSVCVFVGHMNTSIRCHSSREWIVISGRSRIFQRGCTNCKGGGANLLLLPIFPKNCMKLKKFEPRGGARVPGVPFGSANGYHLGSLHVRFHTFYMCGNFGLK